MTITADDLRTLRQQLAQAEHDFDAQQRQARPNAMAKLRDYMEQLERIEKEAKALAESVGLVFYYSTGYEHWSYVESKDWSPSTAHC